MVDMVLWFAGDDLEEISATMRPRADTGVEETAVFKIRFARGARGAVPRDASSADLLFDGGHLWKSGANNAARVELLAVRDRGVEHWP